VTVTAEPPRTVDHCTWFVDRSTTAVSADPKLVALIRTLDNWAS
jgi:hypothetical protein